MTLNFATDTDQSEQNRDVCCLDFFACVQFQLLIRLCLQDLFACTAANC